MPRGKGLGNFWTFDNLSEISHHYILNQRTPKDAFQAKLEAEQVLILIGLGFRGARNRYSQSTNEQQMTLLVNTGQALYDIAAEEYPVIDQRDAFASMSTTFHNWTRVLSQIQIHEFLSSFH
jgi:hypothetical protein